MKALKTMIALASALALSSAVACSSDDDGTAPGDGDGDMTPGDGDGDGTGGTPGDGDGDDDCQSIVEIASGNEDFSVLVAALTKAGLVEAVQGNNLTVFAPTNDAFVDLLGALGLESLDDLSAEQLIPILTYHVMGSVVDSAAAISVAEGDGVATTLGGTIRLALDGDDLVIDPDEFPATVVTPDIEACNGIIHVIDAVIVPSIADIVTSQASFSGLATLLGAAESSAVIGGVLDGEGGFTLFAPSNDAISAVDPVPGAAALDDILQYHVYNGVVYAAAALDFDSDDGQDIEMLNEDILNVKGGTGVTLTDTGGNESTVTVVDLYAANGVIHVIDGVLLPESITAD